MISDELFDKIIVSDHLSLKITLGV